MTTQTKEPGVSNFSAEQEFNPWEAQAARFDLAAQKLKLDPGIWKVLRYPNREIIVHIPVLMDKDRKSTRLNSSHSQISYAVFCLKKKKKKRNKQKTIKQN